MKKQENLDKSKEIFASIDFRQDGKVSLEELKADYDFVTTKYYCETPEEHGLRMKKLKGPIYGSQETLNLKYTVY